MSSSSAVRLIVGLGNPGADYDGTRHNAGFALIDDIAKDLNTSFGLEKGFFGMLAKARVEGDQVILLKPMTYMNRSGMAVAAVCQFYKFKPEQVWVLHDELDLLPGQIKMKQGGGHAGHNGLKDIQSALSSPAFWRLRIGIGHPRTLGLNQPVSDFVLHAARRDEQALIDETFLRARAITPWMLQGRFDKASENLGRG